MEESERKKERKKERNAFSEMHNLKGRFRFTDRHGRIIRREKIYIEESKKK
jgi:hypothetical protein